MNQPQGIGQLNVSSIKGGFQFLINTPSITMEERKYVFTDGLTLDFSRPECFITKILNVLPDLAVRLVSANNFSNSVTRFANILIEKYE